MGVKDLWSVLEPCKSSISLDDLQGSTLAVDLGFWTCQMASATEFGANSVHKLHLRLCLPFSLPIGTLGFV